MKHCILNHIELRKNAKRRNHLLMNIHIFYNGNDFEAPTAQADRWSNYSNENSPRLFLACAASWMKQGWNVKRLVTTETKGFEFVGVLRRDLDRYPLAFWNTWFVWERIAPCFVCNMDVFNLGLKSSYFCNNWDRPTALHTNGWTASIGFVDREFCRDVIETIKRVDKGVLEAPNCEMFCDDRIVQKYFSPQVYPVCTFAHIRSDWTQYDLVQFPRSTINRCLETIPTII